MKGVPSGKYIPPLVAAVGADSQEGGMQGVSLGDAHPDRYLTLPFPLKIPGPILLKQIATYV